MAEKLSYTSVLKQEILSNKRWRTTFKKQLIFGVLSFAQHFDYHNITLSTKDTKTAHFFVDFVPQIIPLVGSITTTETPSGGSVTYTVTVDSEPDRRNLLNYYAMLYPEGVTFDLLGGDEGTAAYIAGAFLACGSISDPEKCYHLEFNITRQNMITHLKDMLCDLGFSPGRVERRGAVMLYFHDSQQIEDVLALIGSSKIALELMGVKIIKERRALANRLSNCDTANIEKTVIAASTQQKAIRTVLETLGENALPEDLRVIALLRLENPELSLRDLGAMLDPPLSRSGVNHRLQRIIKLANS